MKVSLDSKYSKFVPKIKAPEPMLASGSCVWASFETRLIQAGVSSTEARLIAENRYYSLIASCAKSDNQLD